MLTLVIDMTHIENIYGEIWRAQMIVQCIEHMVVYEYVNGLTFKLYALLYSLINDCPTAVGIWGFLNEDKSVIPCRLVLAQNTESSTVESHECYF